MKWYLTALKKYAVFSGRARRKEYWMFLLWWFIIAGILGFIQGSIEGVTRKHFGSIFINIYLLANLIPYFAVSVRRKHDIGKSGWFVLIPIYGLILNAKEGNKGDNQYGPDPKAKVLFLK